MNKIPIFTPIFCFRGGISLDISFDSREIARTFRRFWWVIAVLALSGFFITCLRLYRTQPASSASASFLVGADLKTTPTVGDYTVTHSFVFTCMSLATSDTVLTQAISTAGLSLKPDQLKPYIDVKAPNGGDEVIVTVTARGSGNAAKLADGIVSAISGRVKTYSTSVPIRITVVDAAAEPAPSGKNYMKSGLVGGAAGLAAAFLLLLLASAVSTKTKNPEVTSRALGLPSLAEIPKNPSKKPDVYRILAAGLRAKAAAPAAAAFAAPKGTGLAAASLAAASCADALSAAGYRVLLVAPGAANSAPGAASVPGEKKGCETLSSGFKNCREEADFLVKRREEYDYILLVPQAEGAAGVETAALGDVCVQVCRYGKTRIKDAAAFANALRSCGVKTAGYILLETPD